VAVVDTADDMNRQAANALLKILEEPPARTLFLVLAHSGRGMPATIRSRCQTLSVRPLSREEVLEALDALGALEAVSESDRKLVGELADGSVRRAIVILRADGLDLYRRFIELASGKSEPDWAAIHQLAGDVSPIARNDRYRLLIDFAHDHVGKQLRGERPQISDLARWVEVWEKIRRSADRTDAYNLDRKQVILNLFSAFHDAA
jgi:DNA polymerase-3 subunit delta'